MENNEKKYPASMFDFEKRPLSYSSLKHVLVSPLHFAYYRNAPKEPPSDAMLFGSLVDCLLLTPEDFDKMFLVVTKFEKRTNEAKERWANLVLQAQTEKKLLIFDEMIPKAKELIECLHRSKRFNRLFEATTSVQKTFSFTDKKTGYKVITKFDALAEIDDKAIIWDLKTSQKAEKVEYPKMAVNFDYPLQGGIYTKALTLNTGKFADFYHVVVESGTPTGVNVFKAPNEWIKHGQNEFRRAMDIVKYCMDNDCFDSGYEYINEVPYDELYLPGWVKRKD